MLTELKTDSKDKQRWLQDSNLLPPPETGAIQQASKRPGNLIGLRPVPTPCENRENPEVRPILINFGQKLLPQGPGGF